MKRWFFVLLILLISTSCANENSDIQAKRTDWRAKQAQYRQQLLAQKPNKNLKNSLLQEWYIKGLVSEKNSDIVFELPFDLHGFDCGAPDCYTTQVNFTIRATQPVTFPKTINVMINTSGCGIDKPMIEKSIFYRVENTQSTVNYYSRDLRSNLLISDKELFYYPHERHHSMSFAKFEYLLNNQAFHEESHIPEPLMSFQARASEYDLFLKQSE